MEWVIIVAGLILCAVCAPIQDINKEDLIFAKQFMTRFGYILEETSDSESAVSLIKVEQAIKDVQKFGGIPQTGELDNSTIQLMKSPRCGVPDILSTTSHRSKRYALAPGSGWKKRHLTYFIANWSPKLGHGTVRSEMQRALNLWGKHGRLQFKETTSPDADIVVSFGRGYHGDSYPFDGPGLLLAHAFFPLEFDSLAGDIHFDEDEQWKVNPGQFEEGVDFYAVAVHEIGHSLGLSHSSAEGSIMNPYYNPNSFDLGYDDILAMYELYIAKPLQGDNESWDEDEQKRDKDRRKTTTKKPWTSTTTSTTTSTEKTLQMNYEGDYETVDSHKSHDPTHGIPGPVEPLTPEPPEPEHPTTSRSSNSEIPNACHGRFSAVAHLRGELFFFKENYIWRLSRPGQLYPGFPVPIQRMFHKLPPSLKKIDAAYERNTDSNIIFISGDKYWIHDGNMILEESPRPISDYGLPAYVKKIDAIMNWAKNQKTYIFSGSEYWRFNETTRTMDSGYPKSIDKFTGVPINLDSAMTWLDGITYFFKDNLYWAFNNALVKTEDFYPQETSRYWLGCR